MKINKLFFWSSFLILLIQSKALASVKLMEVSELAQMISAQSSNKKADHFVNSQYVIIDARESGYDEAHIPGSYNMRWKDWIQKNQSFMNPTGLVLEDLDRIQKQMNSMGLHNQSQVVIYADSKSWGAEGRIAWNLLYWGLEKVYLLNGGIEEWSKQKNPLTKDKPHFFQDSELSKKFEIRFDQSRRLKLTELKTKLDPKTHQSPYQIIDVRSEEEFKGRKVITGQKRPGHIPHATNITFKSLYDQNGLFISKQEFIKNLKKLKTTEKNQLVSYCTGGVRAALYAMLYEAYTQKKMLNYDGSIWEWASDQSLPMNTESGSTQK